MTDLQRLSLANHRVLMAFDAENDAQAIDLAWSAIELHPDCADAYTLLAEHTVDCRDALNLCTQGVQAAMRSLGDDDILDKYRGGFWRRPESRPYMRASLALSLKLWDVGKRKESVRKLLRLLKLNPADDQGIRYLLAGRLLELGRDEELAKLLNRFDETSTLWMFTQVLALFRRVGDTTESRKALAAARRRNKFVVPMLLDLAPRDSGGDWDLIPGSKEEADRYLEEMAGGWRYTPGSITWLRQVMFDLYRAKHPGKPAIGPTDSVKRRLKKPALRYGTQWQATFTKVATWFEEGEMPIRPWSIVVANVTGEKILGQEMVVGPPTPAQVFDVVAAAIVKPLVGKPHRPSEIQVLDGPVWDEVRPHLEEIGVDCIVRPKLSESEFILLEMQQMFLSQQEQEGLVQIRGIDIKQVGSFFQASDQYFRHAPWSRVPVETAIRIECPQFTRYRREPYYAVPMGQSNVTLGLALYDDLETIQTMWWEDEADLEDTGHARSLVYSEAFEIPMADLLACEERGWPVPTPEAYPLVLDNDPSHENPLPRPWELHLLEGCLRAVPLFVDRHSLLEDEATETIAIQTATGQLDMTLTWSPKFNLPDLDDAECAHDLGHEHDCGHDHDHDCGHDHDCDGEHF
ncbi:MAG: hypothetical protein ACKV0T_20950 [Planctomycetales bacterium]